MSVWGTGAFENDEAAAWCDELDDHADPGDFAVRTLRTGDTPGRVVAAASWLAAGVPGVAEPVDGPSTPPITPDAETADAAVEALGAVLTDEPWFGQWADPAERAAARAYVRSVIETWETTIG
ncbi:DUF4259 domain-containing protein [Nocardioides sp.]|uniref:DUF4259 domain-containing protein n=1 Tax=Nocardioides sp. TaxID=35761 RepID=UPI00272424A1|nr:DUF4259 domain-containing protein [Nocardioides sp.]MDO9455384.1 DUF4259 domain-containing protein [Nocardioides sp.]